jgi:flagellar basal-body rod modification protein FlgD
MAIDALGVVTSQAAVASPGVTQQQFLQILLTQLRFQDPLKPMDDSQFVAQLAQFSALEVNTEQSAKIDSLLSIEAASQAVAMIGREVQVSGANAGQVGNVSAISFDPSTGEPLLTITTSQTTLTNIQLSDIALITTPATSSVPTIPDPTIPNPTVPTPSAVPSSFTAAPLLPNLPAGLPAAPSIVIPPVALRPNS